MKVLVIAAHPDDEVLGCGGAIARLAKEGHELNIAILGEGVTSRYEKREAADQSLIGALQAKSRQVAELLGATSHFQGKLPDNRFDTIPLLEVIKDLERLVEEIQPEVIFTHGGADLNIDHTIVHRAVLTATRPMASCPVKAIYTFEIPSSTEWAFGQFHSPFRPNVFVDIVSSLEIKIQAMAVYESESRPFPHPRSREALLANARRWGSVVGLEAAEAFELVRKIQ